jgi:hypothetical protein
MLEIYTITPTSNAMCTDIHEVDGKPAREISENSVKTPQEHHDTRKQLDKTRKMLDRGLKYTFKTLREISQNSVKTQ